MGGVEEPTKITTYREVKGMIPDVKVLVELTPHGHILGRQTGYKPIRNG